MPNNNQYTANWSKNEDDWLIENYSKMPYEKLVIELKNDLGYERTYGQIRHRVNLLIGGRKPRAGVNGGEKAVNDRVPIGTISSDGKTLWIKVTDTAKHGKRGEHYYRDDWMRYGKYVWEQAYGKLRGEDTLLWLDGNRLNCELDNLIAIPKKYLAMMCREKWTAKNTEMRKTAIAYCKLFYALKGDME